MKIINCIILLVFVYVLFFVGAFLFAQGFLLNRTEIPTKSPCKKPDLLYSDSSILLDGCWMPRSYSRAVFIIIDALRYDFLVYNNSNEHSYYKNKFNNVYNILKTQPSNSALFKFIADPPTTTLQRLKGMTTGSLPTFIDIGRNFAGTEIVEDSVLHQLKQNGRNITFMGDDTWMSLFKSCFIRSYPFPSFNVKDLHTVDNGVLDHLFPEMARSDWQLLIGHFLGLDHCGHWHGPDHPEMEKKMRQMDQMISDVVEALPDDTLLLVMGDHGMTPDGNHGGDSSLELDAALFMYSKRDLHHNKLATEVAQIDLVPTLSLLIGVPIPYSNLGSPISGLFRDPTLSMATTAFQVNRYMASYAQVAQPFSSDEVSLLTKQYNVAMKNHVSGNSDERLFEEYLGTVKDLCRRVWAKFDVELIAGGVLFTVLSILWVVLVNRMISLFESSTVIGKWITMPVVLLSCSLGASIMAVRWAIFGLPNAGLTVAVIIACFLAVTVFRGLYVMVITIDRGRPWRPSFNNLAASLILLIYLTSLGSNTFVNHEDKTLPFLFSSLLVAITSHSLWQRCPRGSRPVARSGHRKREVPGCDVDPGQRALSKCRVAFYAAALLVLTKAASYFNLCREEQLPDCENSLFTLRLDALQPSSRNLRYLFAVLCISSCVAMVIARLRSLGNVNGYSPCVTFTRYGLPATAVVSALFWALRSLPGYEGLPVLQQTLFPQLAYFLILLGLLCFLANPTMLYRFTIEDKVSLEIDSNTAVIPQLYLHMMDIRKRKSAKPTLLFMVDGEDDRRVVYGLASCFSASIVYLHILVAMLTVILLGDGFSPAMLLCLLQTYLLLELLVCVQLRDNKQCVTWWSVVLWGLLASRYFFVFGHQAVFNSIRFDAAYVGFHGDWNVYITPLLMILSNTYASQVMFVFGLPLLVSRLTSLSTKKGELEIIESGFTTPLLRVINYFLIFNGSKLLATMVMAAILRRHLMVWKIFAPRFVFEVVSFLFTGPLLLLVFLLCCRLDSKLTSFVKNLVK